MSVQPRLFSWNQPHDRQRGEGRVRGFPKETMATFARLYDAARGFWPQTSVGFVQREDVNRQRTSTPSAPWVAWGKGKGWPLTHGPKASFWRATVREFSSGDELLQGLTAVGGEDPFLWQEGGSGLVLLGSCLHEGMLCATDAVPHHEKWCQLLREVGMIEPSSREVADSLRVPSLA